MYKVPAEGAAPLSYDCYVFIYFLLQNILYIFRKYNMNTCIFAIVANIICMDIIIFYITRYIIYSSITIIIIIINDFNKYIDYFSEHISNAYIFLINWVAFSAVQLSHTRAHAACKQR